MFAAKPLGLLLIQGGFAEYSLFGKQFGSYTDAANTQSYLRERLGPTNVSLSIN